MHQHWSFFRYHHVDPAVHLLLRCLPGEDPLEPWRLMLTNVNVNVYIATVFTIGNHMALSANERKQRQLARDEATRRRMPDSTYPFLTQPFHEWLEVDGNWDEVEAPLRLCGIQPPQFDDDSGPAEHSIHEISDREEHADTFAAFERSIGRAELMAELLIGAGESLARMVNRFKKEELDQRLVALGAEDFANADRRRAALAEVAQITRLQEELQKNIRRTLPQWMVKGV